MIGSSEIILSPVPQLARKRAIGGGMRSEDSHEKFNFLKSRTASRCLFGIPNPAECEKLRESVCSAEMVEFSRRWNCQSILQQDGFNILVPSSEKGEAAPEYLWELVVEEDGERREHSNNNRISLISACPSSGKETHLSTPQLHPPRLLKLPSTTKGLLKSAPPLKQRRITDYIPVKKVSGRASINKKQRCSEDGYKD